MADVKPLVPDLSNDGFFRQIQDADRLTLAGGITSASDIVLTGGSEVTGLPSTPSGPTAAVSSAYLTAFLNGIDYKESVRVATAAALPAYTAAGAGVGKTLTGDDDGILSIDSLSPLTIGDRVLVKNEGASHADHGIYVVVNPGAVDDQWELERAEDADENDEVTSGLTCWVEEGTSNNGKRYTLSTADPITVDTTAITFVQSGGQGLYTGGDGIDITSGVVSVDLATNSGLQFTSNKLDLDLKDATLGKDADGVYVAGLPLEFTINGVATSTNVTAANVNTLTAGPSSNADSLHTHSIDDVVKTVTALENIALGDPVEWSATAGKVQKCRADTASKIDVIGIALEAINADATGQILTNGTAVGVLSGATSGARQFLGDVGGIEEGQGNITAGNYLVNVGIAKNTTDLEFRVIYLGTK